MAKSSFDIVPWLTFICSPILLASFDLDSRPRAGVVSCRSGATGGLLLIVTLLSQCLALFT